jgi:SAM-dependent methyltransferase
MREVTSKDFWDERYRTGNTPWDYGGIPPELNEFLADLSGCQRILIPGCGSAHDLRTALDHGHDAIGIDLSEEAVEVAKKTLGTEGDRLFCGDFFTHPFNARSFDVIYERTFLCALPPELRRAYADRMHELLKPGGRLIGYFVYGEEPEPPPYPLAPSEAEDLFKAKFELTDSRESLRPLPLFETMEWWQIWKHAR